MKKYASLQVSKREFNFEAVEEVLTVPNPEYVSKVRFGSMEYGEIPDEKLCFLKRDDFGKWVLPRNTYKHLPEYFNAEVIDRMEVCTNLGSSPKYKYIFTGVLRPYQKDFMRTVDMKEDDLTLIMACGTGKTIVGAYLTCQRQTRTIVLVPKIAIAHQWVDAYKNFTNIKGIHLADPRTLSKLDLNTVDVLIISFDLFYERSEKLPESFYDHFGHVILDEAHRVGAPTYQPVLDLVNSTYRTALTATFRRADGMHRILSYHFGKLYKLEHLADKAVVYPLDTNISVDGLFNTDTMFGGAKNRAKNLKMMQEWFTAESIEFRYRTKNIVEFDINMALIKLEKYRKVLKKMKLEYNETRYMADPERYRKYETIIKCVENFKKLNETSVMTLVDTLMGQETRRNRVILDVLRVCATSGRTIMFLSKRKEPLKKYAAMFERLGYKVGLIISETQKDEKYMRYVREEAQIIFGISQIVKEGLDIPRLDTLLLHHVMKDGEQAIGRITRDMPDKLAPLVIYPFDNYKPYQYMYYGFLKICKKKILVRPATTLRFLREKIYHNSL